MATDKLPNSTQMASVVTALNTIAAKSNTPYSTDNKLPTDFATDTNQTNKFATQAQLDQIETNKNNILSIADQSTQYNILPPNLEKTASNNRITVTANGDGTVTVTTENNGASANTFFGIGSVYLNVGDYYLLGGISNLLRLQDNTDTYFDSGSGALMHITTAANYTIYLRVNVGYTNTSGVVVKPRIVPKSTYDAGFTNYQLYAMSNVELTEQNNIEDISSYVTAQTGYTIDSTTKLIKQGKHIFGIIIVKKSDTNFTTSQEQVATIGTYPPAYTYLGISAFSGSLWSVNNIGYLFIQKSGVTGAGIVTVCDNFTTNNCVKIPVNYVTD